MTVSFKTFSSAPNTPLVERFPGAAAHFVDRASADRNVDFKGTINNSEGREDQTLSGPARAVAAGKDVVIDVSAFTAMVSLVVQESADGVSWATVGTFPLPKDSHYGVRFTPGSGCNFYRAQVVLTQAANRVYVLSQNRN